MEAPETDVNIPIRVSQLTFQPTSLLADFRGERPVHLRGEIREGVGELPPTMVRVATVASDWKEMGGEGRRLTTGEEAGGGLTLLKVLFLITPDFQPVGWVGSFNHTKVPTSIGN